MNAMALLKHQHEQVAALFEQYETASDDDRSGIAARICQLLTLHGQIEEEIFYPHARAALAGDGAGASDRIDAAVVAHESVKALVAQIQGADRVDALFHARVRILNEYVARHVKEEELELFPRLESTSLDVTDLGRTLQDRKADLTVQLGMTSDDCVTPRSGLRGSSGARRRFSR